MSTFCIERTLAVIKPFAVQNRFSILRRIFSAGFHILQERCVKLSITQAEEFFKNKERDDIQEWSSGPLIALCLSCENAVELWKKLMGPENCSIAKESSPTCLRALYGSDGNNPLYGTNCVSHAQRELRFFFPNMTFESFPTSIDDIKDHLSCAIYQPLTEAIYELLQEKPNEPIEWIANYMLKHNVKQPLMHSTCPDALNLLQRLKNDEKLKQIERDQQLMEQKNQQTKCGCSLTSASSISSV